jgi:hypothetical protein
MPLTANENRLDRQRRYAWAMYYEQVRTAHEHTIVYVNRQARVLEDPTLPTHIKNEIEEMRTAMRKEYECPICMDMIASGELDITNCGHKYCKECLKRLLTQPEPKCACCRKALKRNE